MHYPVGKDKNEYLTKWYVASGFNERRSTTYIHEGIDLNLRTGGDTDLGQPIYAIGDYELCYYHLAKHANQNAYGIHFVYSINTPFGKRWIQCEHVQADPPIINNRTGKEGDVIAYLGKTGTTVAHLHLAVYKVDPASFGGIDVVVGDEQTLKTWWENPTDFLSNLDNGGNMAVVYKGLDLTNQESMKVAVDVWDEVINKKIYVKLSDIQDRFGVPDLDGLATKLSGKDSRITDLTNQLGTAQAEVTNKDEIIKQKDATIANLNLDNQTLIERLEVAAENCIQLGKDKGNLAIEVEQLKIQVETLKSAQTQGEVTLTLKELFLLLWNQKITIKKG